LFDDASNWRSGVRVVLQVKNLFKKQAAAAAALADKPAAAAGATAATPPQAISTTVTTTAQPPAERKKRAHGVIVGGLVKGRALPADADVREGDWISYLAAASGDDSEAAVSDVRRMDASRTYTGVVLKVIRPKKGTFYGFITTDDDGDVVYFAAEKSTEKYFEAKDRVRFRIERNAKTHEPNAVQVERVVDDENKRKALYGFVEAGAVNGLAVPADFNDGDWVSFCHAGGTAADNVARVQRGPASGTVLMFLPGKYGFILPDGATALADADGNRSTLFFSADRVKEPPEPPLQRKERVRFVIEPAVGRAHEPTCVNVVRMDAGDALFPLDPAVAQLINAAKKTATPPPASSPSSSPIVADGPRPAEPRPMRLQLMKKGLVIDVNGIAAGGGNASSAVVAAGPDGTAGFTSALWQRAREGRAVNTS